MAVVNSGNVDTYNIVTCNITEAFLLIFLVLISIVHIMLSNLTLLVGHQQGHLASSCPETLVK